MERKEIKEKLNALLILKFTNQGIQLFKEVEEQWKNFEDVDPQQLYDAVRESNDDYNQRYEAKESAGENGLNILGVTVALPINEEAKPSSQWPSWLVGAACFPWELDPCNWNDFSATICLDHVMTQLAYSSYKGNPYASSLLRRAARKDEKLPPKHPFLKQKISVMRAYEQWRFPIELPDTFKPSLQGTPKDFSEMSEVECVTYFNKLYELESKGTY